MTLVDGTGARYDSQYVVVDADMVITSNDINGQPNNLYGVEGVDAAYAVAGNGRVTALNHAYDLGTADTYKQELMQDAARHGVDPDVIAQMQRPILVRVVDKERLPADIADRTNTRTTAEMSMVEQAINDAQRIDLASLEFTADGNVSPDTVAQFVKLMPASERNRLSVNNVPTAEAKARLDAAIFQAVYKTPGLTGLLDTNGAPAGVATMLRAYRALAPKLIDLDGTGDVDVRTALAEVLNEFASTRANGQKLSVAELAAQMSTTRSPMAQAYLDYFAKVDKEGGGYKRIVDDISSSADLIRQSRAMAEADAASGGAGMFGDVTTLSQRDVMRRFADRTGIEIDEKQFINTDSLKGAVEYEAQLRAEAERAKVQALAAEQARQAKQAAAIAADAQKAVPEVAPKLELEASDAAKAAEAVSEIEKRVSDAAIIRESIEHVRASAEDADLQALTNQALIVLEDSPDMVIPLTDETGNPASISAAELIAREDARAAELEKVAMEGVTTAVACALVNNGI